MGHGAKRAAKSSESKALRLKAQLVDESEIILWRRRGHALISAIAAGVCHASNEQSCARDSQPSPTASCSHVELPNPDASLDSSQLATISFELPHPSENFQKNAESCLEQAD